jgi:hypothetical protein
METLIIFGGAIAAIWVPHLIGHFVIRARYYVRSHRGYTAPHNGVES